MQRHPGFQDSSLLHHPNRGLTPLHDTPSRRMTWNNFIDSSIVTLNAWHLAHIIREAFSDGNFRFSGPVGTDETYMDGKATVHTDDAAVYDYFSLNRNRPGTR